MVKVALQVMRIHNKKAFEDRRRKLKGNMTDAEKVLWSYLRRKQLKGRRFRRQHGIGKYIVDFYCSSEKLIVEVDGDIHLKPDQRASDQKRTMALEAMGYRVIRFRNKEVFREIKAVLHIIGTSFRDGS